MRLARRLLGVFLLVGLVSSCDTDQPLQVTSQTLAIRITAVNSQAFLINVWDMIEDNNNDLLPDDGMTYQFCQAPNGHPQFVTANSVPWNFSVEITVLRGGTLEQEVITSPAALATNFNTAEYDTLRVIGATPFKPDINVVDGGMNRRFRFSNPRRLTSANRTVVAATSNPLNDFDDTTYGYLSGLCSEGDPGPASLDSAPFPYTLEIRKGDTVKVSARKNIGVPPLTGDFDFDGVPEDLVTIEPVLAGTMFLDGTPINVRGTTTSQTVAGDGISFSFTSR